MLRFCPNIDLFTINQICPISSSKCQSKPNTQNIGNVLASLAPSGKWNFVWRKLFFFSVDKSVLTKLALSDGYRLNPLDGIWLWAIIFTMYSPIICSDCYFWGVGRCVNRCFWCNIQCSIPSNEPVSDWERISHPDRHVPLSLIRWLMIDRAPTTAQIQVNSLSSFNPLLG